MSQAQFSSEPIMAGMGIAADASAVVAPAAGHSVSSSGSSRYETHAAWSGGTRSLESGDTHRLNQAQWQNAQDVSINQFLFEKLATIRARANHELHNNGMLLGMINSHADDIVGPEGPTLQVISDDDAYNEAAEWVWRNWFAAPTPDPNMSGASWLKLNIRSLWKAGEFLGQKVTVSDEGPVTLRIDPIPARDLFSPMDADGQPDVFMGIRFANRRPAAYYVKQDQGFGLQDSLTQPQPVPADLMIHEFIREEEKQRRGLPWLNTAIQPAADLRDYDIQVMDAARQMANQSSAMKCTHQDMTPWPVPETFTVHRGTISTLPPGWELDNMVSTQPMAQYEKFRAERSREFGRPMGIPLLVFMLDSSGHNYSSARLDTQAYRRSLTGLQIWLSGGEQGVGLLSRLADEVLAEARFSIPRLRRKPARVTYQWTWPALPHVDPSKEALADDKRLKNLTLSLADAAAKQGVSLESHIAKLVRVRKMLEENDLPVPAELKALPVVPPPSPSPPAPKPKEATANAK